MWRYRALPMAQVGPIETSGRRLSETVIAMAVDTGRGDLR